MGVGDKSGGEAPSRRLLQKSRQQVMATWTRGIKVEMLRSGQSLPLSLLSTPFPDQYKKLKLPEQNPVHYRRCISEEEEGEELDCGAHSRVNTFCPHPPSPMDPLSVCALFQHKKCSAFLCTIQRLLPLKSHLPFLLLL